MTSHPPSLPFPQQSQCFVASLPGVYVFAVVEAHLRPQVKLSPQNGPNAAFFANIDQANGFLLCYLDVGQPVNYFSPVSFNLAGVRLGDEL